MRRTFTRTVTYEVDARCLEHAMEAWDAGGPELSEVVEIEDDESNDYQTRVVAVDSSNWEEKDE